MVKMNSSIEEAVKKAEAKTSGEIVPVILEVSDNYPGATWRFGITCALFFVALLYVYYPYLDFLVYLLIEILLIFIGILLAQVSFLKRLFVSNAEKEEEVYQKAVEIFYERSLHSTRDRTGILILVSLLEHRVQILADIGINSVVPLQTWDHIAEELIVSIRHKQLQEGMCQAITSCGDILATYFPVKADDINELEN